MSVMNTDLDQLEQRRQRETVYLSEGVRQVWYIFISVKGVIISIMIRAGGAEQKKSKIQDQDFGTDNSISEEVET